MAINYMDSFANYQTSIKLGENAQLYTLSDASVSNADQRTALQSSLESSGWFTYTNYTSTASNYHFTILKPKINGYHDTFLSSTYNVGNYSNYIGRRMKLKNRDGTAKKRYVIGFKMGVTYVSNNNNTYYNAPIWFNFNDVINNNANDPGPQSGVPSFGFVPMDNSVTFVTYLGSGYTYTQTTPVENAFLSAYQSDIPAMNTVEIEFDIENEKISFYGNNKFMGSFDYTQITSSAAGEQQLRDSFANKDFLNIFLGSNITTNSSSYRHAVAMSDFYYLDDNGENNNRRLGKVKILSRLPASDIETDFIRPDLYNANYQVVSQVPIDSSVYLKSSGVGDKDVYGGGSFSELSNETILAVGTKVVGNKTDPTGNNIAALIRIDDVDYLSENVELPVNKLTAAFGVFDINPKTNLKFTKAQVEAMGFGLQVVSADTNDQGTGGGTTT